MSGLKSRKGEDLQNRYPGCMGRMINVFDLSAGMGGTKVMLSDRAHNRDGSPGRKNRSDVKKSSENGVPAEEKQTSDLKKSPSGKKSGGTPMKMLIAQEMSKETGSTRKQPNIVARLMGLDEALPARQSVLKDEGSLLKSSRHSSLRITLAGAFQNSQQHEESMPCEVCSCTREKDCRDVDEVWWQSNQNRRCDDIQTARRMALVHQKFMETKRLATDGKLLQSKEFQDALEVLSSNRDLFLKFLEEPNSLFLKHLNELHSTPGATQPKRITILKPSRMVEKKGDAQAMSRGWDQDMPQRSSAVTQPTRIVVLKPSTGKNHEAKPIVKPHVSSLELTEKEELDLALETLESTRFVEATQDIGQQMRASICSSRRDDSLLSSVLSTGYVGDESSLNRSENGYRGEDDGSFSDSDIPSPTSRRSWDYSNIYGSPVSYSSFSRASCSPEPSVIREAKKRLSERWTLVASNGSNQQQVEVRRSSSTLGEMLAIPEIKKEEARVRGLGILSSRSCSGEDDLRVSNASLPTCQSKDEDGAQKSSCNLPRSKSLPGSSASENLGLKLNSEVSNSEVKKSAVAKDAAKSKSGRSSFKGKVSSLFFSRIKNSGRDKSISSSKVGSDILAKDGSVNLIGKETSDALSQVQSAHPEGTPQLNSDEESPMDPAPASVKTASNQGTLSFRAVLSIEKPNTSENLSDSQKEAGSSNKVADNQNQPSPTSVLDMPFQDDATNSTPGSEISAAGCSLAPIESVARTLSWEDGNLETCSLHTSTVTDDLHNVNGVEEQCHLFVQNLLATAELNNMKLDRVFSRWHSVDSPLDPVLLDRFLDRKQEDAKNRERRSNQRLMFDCINSALLEIGRASYLSAYPWPRTWSSTRKTTPTNASVGDEVWVILSDWFSGQGKFEPSETQNCALLVDRVLRREIGGNGWTASMQSAVDELSEEISGKILKELVGEALVDLTVERLS